MPLFDKFFREDSKPDPPKEWIAVYFRLTGGGSFGSAEERTEIHQFTDQLAAVIQRQQVGVFDGDEYGDGEGALFMYGPHADRLFNAVYPLLNSWRRLKGGHAIKRYGAPEGSERVDF